MGIAQKLCAASKACGYVQKDGANNFHKYRFVSAANILGHVNAALEAAGLAVVDTLPEIVSETGAGKDRVVTARMTLTVADTESGERATFRGLGSGMDSGDKAVMKAVTAATKYAWMGAFSISTGDDPEADEETDKRAAQSSKPQRQSSPQRTARREEPDEEPARHVEPTHEDAPQEMPEALEGFLKRVESIELPGEAVNVWIKHRTQLASLAAVQRESAWKALVDHTERVGKMRNAKVWLKKAIKEHDDRVAASPQGENGAAA